VTHHLPTPPPHSGSIPRHIGDASIVHAAGGQTVAAARYRLSSELIQGPNPIGTPTNVRVVTVSERLRPFDQPSRYQFAVIGS